MAAKMLLPQVLVVLDMQEGLYHLTRDFDLTLYRHSMLAHAAIGKIFDIPTIMSSSTETVRAKDFFKQIYAPADDEPEH